MSQPTVIGRASTRFSATGQSSKHIIVPKPIWKDLGWVNSEEIIILRLSDNSLRVLTLEQYFRERLEAERAAGRLEAVGVHA